MANDKILQDSSNLTAKMQQDDAAKFQNFAQALDTYEGKIDENLIKMEALGEKFPQLLQGKNEEPPSSKPSEQSPSFKI